MTGSRPRWSTLPLIVDDPTIRQPGRYWWIINHFKTNQGHCISCHKKCGLAASDKCQCGKRQTMFHIANSCPRTDQAGEWPTAACKVFLTRWLGPIGYVRQMATLDAPKLLLLTNQTKLTLTVKLTLTDTETVIYFTRISLTPIKRLYRNNERNSCRGAVAGFVGGPAFYALVLMF